MVIAVLFCTAMPSAVVFAQDSNPEVQPEELQSNLLERIQEESGGNVQFLIPENIVERIFAKPTAPKKQQEPRQSSGRPGVFKQQGFRVQIFSDGRNQASLEARARARGNAVVTKFPKYRGQVYTFSSAPNWFCRVGNFRSQAEANSALSELKRAFPAFAGEMRVVKSQIVLIK